MDTRHLLDYDAPTDWKRSNTVRRWLRMSASLHVRRAKNGKPAVHPIRSTAQKTPHARADAHSTAEQINGFSAAHVRPGSLVCVCHAALRSLTQHAKTLLDPMSRFSWV
jgi:hypothetical protein